MRVAFFGDITGAAGLDHLCSRLGEFRRREAIDLVIVNADNSAITGPHPMGGSGTTLHHVNRLKAAGADIVTLGSHAFDGPEANLVHALPWVVRAMNAGADRPGRGWVELAVNREPLLFVNLCVTDIGNAPSDPWEAWQSLPTRERVIVHAVGNPHDVRVFGHAVDGSVDVVFGTLGHEASRHDHRLPRGTMLVTDVGMVGPNAGIGGFSPEWAVSAFTGAAPDPQPYALLGGDMVCDGVVATLGAGPLNRLERVPEDLGANGSAPMVAEPEQRGDDRTYLRIGLIADPHVDLDPPKEVRWHNPYRLKESPELFARAFERCRQEGADLVVVLGDLSDRGDAAAFERVLQEAEALGCWAWLLPGNHDVGDGGKRLREMTQGRSSGLVSQGPFSGQRLAGGIQLAALDLEASDEPWVAQSRGSLAPMLAGDELRCLFAHYPLVPTAAEVRRAGFKHAGDLRDFAEVHAAVMRCPMPQIVFSGHLHLRGEWVRDNVLAIACGPLIEAPHEIAIVDLAKVDGLWTIARRCISIRAFDEEVLPVLCGTAGSWVYTSRGWQAA
ncbi:YmdB family metallophosphoesterase [Novosphingobium mathurense]|uniref:Calcineurin-like phosphoesterase n=1 Tax=Novosphingobium mathurense TaxID=428990 RepID=A0A1U6H681_9SPHN|nr:YmdB family metallophosphoesterase [Novosphingobium mathurense]SLJ91291.1 Calcineurin-like phosphoesterase [Novosphingobium mathurense]